MKIIRTWVVDATPPEDHNVLWMDVSTPSRILCKIYLNGEWQCIEYADLLDFVTREELETAVNEAVAESPDIVSLHQSVNEIFQSLNLKVDMSDVNDAIEEHNTSELSHLDLRSLLGTCVGLPTYNSNTHVITFTTKNGTTLSIDLPIEQIALEYNTETKCIEFTNASGTITSIPVEDFIQEYVGSIGDNIQVTIESGNAINCTLLDQSIDITKFTLELQERLKKVCDSYCSIPPSILVFSENTSSEDLIDGMGGVDDIKDLVIEINKSEVYSVISSRDAREVSLICNEVQAYKIVGDTESYIISVWVPQERYIRKFTMTTDNNVDFTASFELIHMPIDWDDITNKPIVDTELSPTSTNAVENKAIYEAINSIPVGLHKGDFIENTSLINFNLNNE